MNLDELSIQFANSTDISDIVDVHIRTWIDTYPNAEFGLTQEMIRSFYRDRSQITKKILEWLDAGHKKIWVAKHHKKIIGYCAVEEMENEFIIDALYVLPQYQKKKIGYQLMETAMASLNDKRDVLLTVAETNEKAIAFYKRYGFEVYDRIPECELPAIGKIKLPLIRMKLIR